MGHLLDTETGRLVDERELQGVAGIADVTTLQLIMRESAEVATLKLDLGCGQSKREGFLGVDKVETAAADFLCDLLRVPWCLRTKPTLALGGQAPPLTLHDGSVLEVYCSHFLEHIPLADTPEGTDLLIAFMNELHRVLTPGGKATLITPWAWNTRAWQDPTHRRVISDATFCYFNKGWRVANGLDHYPITADFDFAPSYILDAAVATRHEEVRAFWMRHYINTINDLQVVLTKREGERRHA